MRGAADEKSPEAARPARGNGTKPAGRAETTNGNGSGPRPLDLARLSTGELVTRIAQDAQGLVKAEIQLAKAELRADMDRLLAGARRAGVAFGLLGAALLVLLAAAVLALATYMAAWLAALIVAGTLFVGGGVAALLAAAARPRAPLERTRRNLKDLKEELPWPRTHRP